MAQSIQHPANETFRHEAIFYDGLDGFVADTTPFVLEGLEAGEPVLVLTPPDRLDALRDVLGEAAGGVLFEDMQRVGRNPGAIISRWRDFLSSQPAGQAVRGIGEPVWAGRSPEELVECRRHEELINLAFAGHDGSILCPYDASALAPDVLATAHHTHPATTGAVSAVYPGPAAIARPFGDPLPPAPADATTLAFDIDGIPEVRRTVRERGQAFGLDDERVHSLQLAVNELATNSVRHGGGSGTLAIWTFADAICCEVRDAGVITDPLAGRQRPPVDAGGGLGLWLVNQVCDLVQLRSTAEGSTVRVRMHRS